MGDQNFNFDRKFTQDGEFPAHNFVFLEANFPTRRTYFFRKTNTYAGNWSLYPLPRRYSLHKYNHAWLRQRAFQIRYRSFFRDKRLKYSFSTQATFTDKALVSCKISHEHKSFWKHFIGDASSDSN